MKPCKWREEKNKKRERETERQIEKGKKTTKN